MEYQVEWSQTRNMVWIHASDGSTVGRFGRFGIDLHNTVTDQLKGLPQCRLCTHHQSSTKDWLTFREKAKEWWNVTVPEDAFDISLLAKPKN